MDRYLGGEEIDVKTLVEDLERAVARGTFHPVLAAAPAAEGARQGLGTVELLELITGGFPTPLERAAPRSPPRTARRARSRPATRTGRWSPRSSRPPPTRTSAGSRWSGSSPARCAPTRRCTSPGTASPTAATRTTTSTSASAPCPPRSASSSAPSPTAIAGDLACVAKLSRAETGDTLSAKDDPLLMEPWEMPDPLLPARHPGAQQGGRGQALARAWPGWSPRTRRCGSNRTRTPTRSSCGAWARPTRTSPWSGCAAATASRSTPYRTRSPCGRRSPTGRPGAAGM